MKTNIGVFFGGRSTEHEISVISASQAMHAIDRNRYNVTPIYITKEGNGIPVKRFSMCQATETFLLC